MWPTSKLNTRHCIQSGLILVVHQIVATEGVIWIAILGTFLLRGSITNAHEAWVHSAFMRALHAILSNTPFFPVQIAVGAYLGWTLYCRWRHRSMLSVWILPGVVLAYAVTERLTISPWPISTETGPLSHYFGWGCRADDRCHDQLFFTKPFYTSVAYSLGALWASRKSKARPRNVGAL
jgi:hypothetical protein